MKKIDIIATSLGNVLEWFDFGLFIFFAPIIGKHFFPTHDTFSANIAAFSVFSLGYFCRPLGGILFGHQGDRYGRVEPLRQSILIITIATLLIGLLPTYETAGLLTSICFVVLRLIQGISAGGEYSGAMIYLFESAPNHQRGLITSFAAAGANIGFLLATLTIMLVTTYLPDNILNDWGWRLPFILVGSFGIFIWYYRLNLSETRTYIHLKKQNQVNKKPLWHAIKFAPDKLLRILAITCMSSTFYNVFFGYMPEYLRQYIGLNAKTAWGLQSILLVVMLFLLPLGGFLGDYYGRKRMLLLTASGIILLALPFFYLLQTHELSLIVVALSFAAFLTSMDQGNNLAAIVESCPASIRYSAIGFSFNLGNALFGANVPLIMTLIQPMGFTIPAYYIMMTASIGFVAILTLSRKPEALSPVYSYAQATTQSADE